MRYFLAISVIVTISLASVGHAALVGMFQMNGKIPDLSASPGHALGSIQSAGSDLATARIQDSYSDSQEYQELVIGLNRAYPESYDSIRDLIGNAKGFLISNVLIDNKVSAVVARLPSANVSLFTDQIRATKLFRYVEPRMKFQAQLDPNDSNWTLQWGPRRIEAEQAWNTTVGNTSVLVAVIDTGINYLHPDIAANYVTGGFDWVNNDEDPMDDNGHGTHCAGIIAAILNNHEGIAGLAQVRIMAEKGLDYSGSGFEDDLANAIAHAVDQGASILSLSWGSETDSQLIHEAIEYASGNGVLIVAAAGNGGSAVKFYPAAYKEVIAVTATDSLDHPASFTSYGNWVELAAPGVHIYSTVLGNSYGFMSGTSMACPHVAGVGALVWSRFADATRDWVRAQLRSAADDLGEVGFDIYYGYGRINARKAVEQTPPVHDLLVLDWERPRRVQPGDRVALYVTVLNFGTSNENGVTVQLYIDGSVTDSDSIGVLPAGMSQTASLSWNPLMEGVFNVTVYVVPVHGEAVRENNGATQMVSVRTAFTVQPSEGTVGSKATASGVDFLPGSQVMLTFNDMLMGFALVDESGSFNFTFNVPLSAAGTQSVKVQDSEGNSLFSAFAVFDTTMLDIKIDTGDMHFTGEVVESYTQTTFKGEAVNVTAAEAMLYEPDGIRESLIVQPVATGLYKIIFTIAGNETGTYALVIGASYSTDVIKANGTSFKCFAVSDTMTLMSRQVEEIRNGVAVVQTDLNSIRLNLTAMNVTLESIFINVSSLNGATANIQTTIGMINGTVTSLNDNVATIVVPELGQIRVDVSGLEADTSKLGKSYEAWTFPQYVVLVVSLIAAISAIVSVLLLRRRRTSERIVNAMPIPP